MWNELAFVHERLDARSKTNAILMQGVVLSAMSKEGQAHFKELLEKL